MFLTMKYNLKLNKEEYNFMNFLCRISKNIYNVSLYELRQRLFNKEEIPTYFELNKIVSSNINYHVLNSGLTIPKRLQVIL